MTMERSRESAEVQLQLADEALSDAQYLLQDNRLRAASGRAYYSMFHAASAALASEGIKLPKTHKGTLALFYQNFVEPGRIARRLHRNLVNAFQLRQQTDYQIYAHVGADEVKETVKNAEAFIAEVKRIVSTE